MSFRLDRQIVGNQGIDKFRTVGQSGFFQPNGFEAGQSAQMPTRLESATYRLIQAIETAPEC
jgi:hypothetical protein